MKFAFVFPGQSSQSVGMMKGYAEVPEVRETFEEASGVLGQDLWKLVEEGPEAALNQTTNTQPVMLTAGVAVYRAWRARGGRQPDVLAGHSLGEYSALVAAGSMSFADAAAVVRVRADAMQRAVPEGVGGIAAILGLDDAVVREVCAEAAQGEVLEPANLNAPAQVVIAGSRSAVLRGMELAKSRGAKRAIMLPMSAPSHCSLMRPSVEALDKALAGISVIAPSTPVIHNADVAEHADPNEIRAVLLRQVYNPVRWVETVQAIAGRGVETVMECGPGKVLAGLNKRIDGRLACHALTDTGALDAAMEVVAEGKGP